MKIGCVCLNRTESSCKEVYIYIYTHTQVHTYPLPVPVAARSKVGVCDRSIAGIVGSNPSCGAWMSACCECCVLSGRELCDGLITRTEESYRVCVSSEGGLEAPQREPMTRIRVRSTTK